MEEPFLVPLSWLGLFTWLVALVGAVPSHGPDVTNQLVRPSHHGRNTTSSVAADARCQGSQAGRQQALRRDRTGLAPQPVHANTPVGESLCLPSSTSRPLSVGLKRGFRPNKNVEQYLTYARACVLVFSASPEPLWRVWRRLAAALSGPLPPAPVAHR